MRSKRQFNLTVSDRYETENQVERRIDESVCKMNSNEGFIGKHIVKLLDSAAYGPDAVSENTGVHKENTRFEEFSEICTEYLGVEPIVRVKFKDPIHRNYTSHRHCVDEHSLFDSMHCILLLDNRFVDLFK